MGRFSPKMVKTTPKVTFWMKNRPKVGIYETVYLKIICWAIFDKKCQNLLSPPERLEIRSQKW